MFICPLFCWQLVEGLLSRFIFFVRFSVLKSVGGLAAISSTCGVAKFCLYYFLWFFAGFSWKNNDR